MIKENESIQKWWMPIKEAYGVDYQCDTVSDCIGVMHQRWAEICRLRKELPRGGFETGECQ